MHTTYDTRNDSTEGETRRHIPRRNTNMALPTMAALMRQRSTQVIQSRGMRAGAELTRLAKWGLPVGAAGELRVLFPLCFLAVFQSLIHQFCLVLWRGVLRTGPCSL